jgi:type II secretory pathway pseudopilin PulG
MFVRHPGRNSSGFTLIEILVICAILAILSSMLIINVRETLQQTERKACFADTRSVANALTTAHFDIGFFPRIGYLNFAVPDLKRLSGSQSVLPSSFDAMGFPDAQLSGNTGMVYNNWGKGGGYLSIGAERANLAAGGSAGYLCKMEIPDLGTSADKILTWPADPWGNPYVVYLIKAMDSSSTDPVGPGAVTSNGTVYSWISKPQEVPNYKALVVSYGPNGIPGGYADERLNVPAGTTDALQDTYALFRRPTAPGGHFRALRSSELNVNHTRALSKDFGYAPGGGIPGILDEGSDDIFQSIH